MIYGVALIASCMFIGFFFGSVLGEVVGIGANVGGVGFAMLLLLIVTDSLRRHNKLSENISAGITFWQSLYIPVVIAMSATQNVLQAVTAGPLAILCGIAVVLAGFVLVWGSSFIPDQNQNKMSTGKETGYESDSNC